MKEIKWGIVGTGWIAERFCTALHSLENEGACVYAVGSRSQAKADAFQAQFGVQKAYGSYEALAEDPEIDILYIATPHHLHYENAMLALSKGKPVLIEKAFTVNAAQAKDLIRLAKENQLFLMEAFWTRFLPTNQALHQAIVKEGLIGEIRMMKADFVKVENFPPEHRIFNINLAGGTLLDLGIYTLGYTTFFMGSDLLEATSLGCIGQLGVDEQCAILMRYPNNALSIQTASLTTVGSQSAMIYGTKGHAEIPSFYNAEEAWIYPDGKEPVHIFQPFSCNGYEYEAKEAMRCLREGLLESPIMPHIDSLRHMEILDECRGNWGFRYPFEN